MVNPQKDGKLFFYEALHLIQLQKNPLPRKMAHPFYILYERYFLGNLTSATRLSVFRG